MLTYFVEYFIRRYALGFDKKLVSSSVSPLAVLKQINSNDKLSFYENANFEKYFQNIYTQI